MKNMKKTLVMVVSLVLIAAIAIGGTIAYLTVDPVKKSNIFTVGDIAIELNEDVAVIGEGGEIIRDDETGATYDGVMPGDYLKKEVSVKNTGTRPAYVAVEVTLNNAGLINKSIDEFYEGKGYSTDEIQAIYDFIFDGFGINYNPRPDDGGVSATGAKNARGVIDGTYGLPEHTLKVDFAKTTDVSHDTYMIDTSNWFKTEQENNGRYSGFVPASKGYYTADMSDYQIRYTYYLLLNEGEESVLFKGFNVPASFNAEQLKMFDGLNIDIEASAIQADNFYGDAKAAFTVLKAEAEGEIKNNAVSDNEDLKNALTKEDKVIVVELNDDVAYDVNAWNDNAMGGTQTELIIINGNGHTLTFNQLNSDWNNIVTNGAKLIINNANINNAGRNDGPWNRHDINFACEIELNNVTSHKAIALKAGGTFNNVTIDDANTSDTYALWIQPNGQTVTLDGCTIDMLDCTDGRGIKIDEQYVNSPKKVTLNVSNTTFKTEEKSAILVKSVAGADINIDNINIYNCAADPINAVWVDEASAAYSDKVVVTGAKVIVEGEDLGFAKAANNAEMDNAIKNGETVIVLKAGTYIIPDSAQRKNLTIIGADDTVIATQDDGSYEGCDYSLDGATVTFENITINTDSTTYTGYARLKATYNNCIINGTFTLYDESTFNNCIFNVTGDVYNIWTWGAPVATFNGCTFNSDGKALLLYGTENTKLTVKNCVFNDKGGLTDLKAAIEIGNDYGKSYELIVDNTIVNGYEINDKGINTNSTLWANKDSMSQSRLNVVVDGVDVY